MLLLRALSARSYTAIIIGWKGSQLHGYRPENAMKHRDADRPEAQSGADLPGIVAITLRSHPSAKAKRPGFEPRALRNARQAQPRLTAARLPPARAKVYKPRSLTRFHNSKD
jgi:hypothetical protein